MEKFGDQIILALEKDRDGVHNIAYMENGELKTAEVEREPGVDPDKLGPNFLHKMGHITRKESNFLIDAIKALLENKTIGGVSDGYHTYNELYHHRAILFATICNLMPDKAWKSKQHDDPDSPMYDGMFICGIHTPEGDATYHYDINPYWDMFKVQELERAPKFDGHTPDVAIERIKHLTIGG